MNVVLVDDWLYIDINGEVGSYGRDEIERNFKSKMKSVLASFIDCEVKVIDAPQEGAQKEALINASFSQEYLIQEERLSSQQCQIIAAKKETIEEIYNYFKPVKVSSVVPYPVSIRALLKNKSLLGVNKTVVFVDDLKTQAIVTIFDGMNFSSPRRIAMRDLVYMAGEIKRSLISTQTKEFILVSNNSEWLHSFIAQGFVSQENIVHLDVNFPVLEGLKIAKFGINFILPQELVRQKRASLARQKLKIVLYAIFPIAIVLTMYLTMYFIRNNAQTYQISYTNERNRLQDKLSVIYKQKYLKILGMNKHIRFEQFYFNFIRNIPYGYAIEKFAINRDSQNGWMVTGTIYPLENRTVCRSFEARGVFKNARVTTLTINKKIGQKIDLFVSL